MELNQIMQEIAEIAEAKGVQVNINLNVEMGKGRKVTKPAKASEAKPTKKAKRIYHKKKK